MTKLIHWVERADLRDWSCIHKSLESLREHKWLFGIKLRGSLRVLRAANEDWNLHVRSFNLIISRLLQSWMNCRWRDEWWAFGSKFFWFNGKLGGLFEFYFYWRGKKLFQFRDSLQGRRNTFKLKLNVVSMISLRVYIF